MEGHGRTDHEAEFMPIWRCARSRRVAWLRRADYGKGRSRRRAATGTIQARTGSSANTKACPGEAFARRERGHSVWTTPRAQRVHLGAPSQRQRGEGQDRGSPGRALCPVSARRLRGRPWQPRAPGTRPHTRRCGRSWLHRVRGSARRGRARRTPMPQRSAWPGGRYSPNAVTACGRSTSAGRSVRRQQRRS